MKLPFAAALGPAAVAGVFPMDTPAISHEYAEVNGVTLHDARSGKGPLIVFLHRFPEFWGEKNTARLPQNLDGLDAYVPNLTIRRIADGTHFVVRERSAEVNRLIREYLGQP